MCEEMMMLLLLLPDSFASDYVQCVFMFQLIHIFASLLEESFSVPSVCVFLRFHPLYFATTATQHHRSFKVLLSIESYITRLHFALPLYTDSSIRFVSEQNHIILVYPFIVFFYRIWYNSNNIKNSTSILVCLVNGTYIKWKFCAMDAERRKKK